MLLFMASTLVDPMVTQAQALYLYSALKTWAGSLCTKILLRRALPAASGCSSKQMIADYDTTFFSESTC